MMISVSVESVRSVCSIWTEESSPEFLFHFLIISVLFATLVIVLMAIPLLHRMCFPKGTKFTREHLIIGKDAILWSDIDHISVKKSEWGNPYLVLYFTDERSPKSYDVEYFPNAEEFVITLKEKAAEERFTFSIGRSVDLKGKLGEKPEIKGVSEVKSYIASWLLYIAVLIFANAVLLALVEDKQFYSNFLLAFLLFACFVLIFAVIEKILSKKLGQTEEHLIIGREAVPWSNIDRIELKLSEMENTYIVLHFRDDTLPKSFDTILFENEEEIINLLRNNAMEKGFRFTIEEAVRKKESIRPVRERLGLETKEEYREQKEIKEDEKEFEIKISPRAKFSIMLFLALFFFLGLYFIIGMRWTISLFLAVLVHECGHLLASRFFHLKAHGLFFIPFFGAGVVLKDKLPSPEVEAAVALAGPVAGLSWNIIAHCDNVFLHTPLFSLFLYIVLVNLLLNVLNLAPILPLDGGRIFRAALLRGRRSLIPVAAVTVGSGVVAGIYLKSIFFLVIAIIGLGSLIYSYKRMEKKEVEPPSRWKSASILGAWIAVICLYWYTLPHLYKIFTRLFLEMSFLD